MKKRQQELERLLIEKSKAIGELTKQRDAMIQKTNDLAIAHQQAIQKLADMRAAWFENFQNERDFYTALAGRAQNRMRVLERQN